MRPTLLLQLATLLTLGLTTFSAAAHEDCTKDSDCATGEVCFEEACSATCKTNSDCPTDQTCADATACKHADDAHEEGCSASAGAGASTLHSMGGLAIVMAVAGVVAVRRRKTRG